MTQYELSRSFWDFTFENPEKIKPTHIALFFFAVEHCNRLGWKEKFGLPASMALEAIGLKSYNTYNAHLSDLVKWGFVKIVKASKNQYSSNIIALSIASSKNNKAYGKALANHASKHLSSTGESTGVGTGSIDKPITIKPDNQITNNILPTAEIQSILEAEEEERKKVAAKKESAAPHWELLVAEWFRFYEEKKGDKPTFGDAHAKSLKLIVVNLQKRSEGKGFVWDEVKSVETLTAFLTYAYRDNWLKDNFLLTNLNSKFDTIIAPKSTNSKISGLEDIPDLNFS